MVHGAIGGFTKTRPSARSNDEAGLSDREQQLATEVDDLKRLHALSLRLAASNTLAEVLNDVLRTAASLVEARLGSAQLLTPGGHLGMVGQIGFGDSIVDEFAVVRLEDCSTCAVAFQRRSRVIVPNLRTDPNFTEIAAALRSYGAVAAVSTPVLDSGGKVLAMFSVYWLEEHEPSDRELRALDLCAELAGRHVERSVAEARQALLVREAAHRGKNLLSVIQAIATRSLSGERTLEEAREVFIGRLQALATSYGTLTDEAPESAQLHDIVSAGLNSHSERADIRGSAVVVPAKTAQTLSLVIHELATNAAKYGALSVRSGRIEVAWELTRNGSDDERFLFKWSEKHGPPVTPPAHKGFGSVIITSVVGSELNCAPTMEYAQDGFRYRLECSLSALSGIST
jgi:two-component sensor histidine kinase